VIEPALLALVPGCESGQQPLRVTPLPGGRGCNEILKIETGAGRFVLRRRLDPVQRPGSDPRVELACHRRAAEAGLAPLVLAAAADGSWMLMPFVESACWQWSDLNCTAGIEALGQRLARVHALALPPGVPLTAFQPLAQAQFELAIRRAPLCVPEAKEHLRRVATLMPALLEAGTPSINHGDLQLGNLLGPLPLMIDWEYAQVCDPTYDLACLLTYYPALASFKQTLLSAAVLPGPLNLERLNLNLTLFDSLNRLWTLANTG
jgi:aminoglycoside phosphotransferase (APT) family kinase protein